MTWLTRLAILGAVVLSVVLSRGFWVRSTAHSLICAPSHDAPVDAAIVENFEPEYPLFEEAARLERRGVTRILVPVEASPDRTKANLVSTRMVEVMAEVAQLRHFEVIPLTEKEPIVLNAAYGIRRFLDDEGIRSVAVIVPAFRSRRSALVYQRVFGDSGIAVACIPVMRDVRLSAWPETWHGVQQVTEQFIKLQYYRFYVLPFLARSAPPAERRVGGRLSSREPATSPKR